MIASAPLPTNVRRSNRFPDLLENGMHLGASEFLRRYETSGEKVKAELINGIVYMASPVRLDQHGEPDNLIQTWLGTYAIATPGVKAAANSTARLGPDDVPQPDGLLRILAEYGGNATVNDKGYLIGAPELVVEVAASSASLDAREKVATYRRAGAREYLLWRTADEAVDWWALKDDEYIALPIGVDGIIRSEAFPGLWLDTAALTGRDGVKLMNSLGEGMRSAEHAAFAERLATQPR